MPSPSSSIISHSARRSRSIKRQSSAGTSSQYSSGYHPDNGVLRWTSTSEDQIPACSEYQLTWEGQAETPFKLMAYQRDDSDADSATTGWHSSIVAQNISNHYYAWMRGLKVAIETLSKKADLWYVNTVASPVNSTVSFTLQDARGVELDSPRPIEITANAFGRVEEDTWCQLSENAVQRDGTAMMSGTSTTASAAVKTMWYGWDDPSTGYDTSPFIILDTYQSQLKKLHAVIGVLAALSTAAIIFGLIVWRRYRRMSVAYHDLTGKRDSALGNADATIVMLQAEKHDLGDTHSQARGLISLSRRPLLDIEELAYALDRTPSPTSTTSTELAARKRESNNPFLDSSSVSVLSDDMEERPNHRSSFLSNATSRITGVSNNSSNEYYHRTKASTIPFKPGGATTTTLIRPPSAFTINSSEEYLMQTDAESSRCDSESTTSTGLSRTDSRRSTASMASTITPPASASSEVDSFRQALSRP